MQASHVIQALEALAPPEYAAEWDNVGLLIGSPQWEVAGLLLTVDLTPAVLREALGAGGRMVVAYHPPIFEPLARLTDATTGQRIALEAARGGVAVYSPHTALDAAPGGVNDWVAEGLGRGDIRALRPQAALPASEQCKLVTFCPADAADRLRSALATVGAGRIGGYELCSFEMAGTGTFLAGEDTSPRVGRKGGLQRVDELRLEMVCPEASLALAVTTLREFHPYEEPPIEIYRLEPRQPLPNHRALPRGRRALAPRGHRARLRAVPDRGNAPPRRPGRQGRRLHGRPGRPHEHRARLPAPAAQAPPRGPAGTDGVRVEEGRGPPQGHVSLGCVNCSASMPRN
jgi:putative NIF3 family GTP cyclohydrolase 1 type 2